MKQGILVISHGSREASWVKQVEELVSEATVLFKQYQISEDHSMTNMQQHVEAGNESASIPIYASYLELVEGKLIQDGITALEQEGVTHIHVMPLFVSYGSSHIDEIKQAFGFEPVSDFIGDLEPFIVQAYVQFHEPIVDDPEVITILQQHLQSMSHDSSHEGVLLLGHGSSYEYFYRLWDTGMKKLMDQLSMEFEFATIDYAPLLPEQSRAHLEQMLAMPQVKSVIVLPIFISPGYFTRTMIPSRLSGLDYVYTGETLLPHPEMAKLLCRRFISMCNV
ncbi:sirohydrochlorin chelatase [Paenibacillus endoradicis]|uniref:sirohydrochlorin chelatase n=1 Tax=Paenibacillus endoradicis TaxID=2972487 RepID=UPI0021592E16|nr:CbiX/SirB N-terminal domain-containing protein [Paenibacillus endoradicis]MCR8660171.1 cobalamin biosynthesis protein CbiX [Paenibacillus endoradicis]